MIDPSVQSAIDSYNAHYDALPIEQKAIEVFLLATWFLSNTPSAPQTGIALHVDSFAELPLDEQVRHLQNMTHDVLSKSVGAVREGAA